MEVQFYGTRGSTPVAGPNSAKYGGNTTCVRVKSKCFDEGAWCLIDAGSGIVPASTDFIASGGKSVLIFFTHYHHDHTQGFPLSAFPYMKGLPISLFGPFEHDTGPKQVFETLMREPMFPINFKSVGSHIQCVDLEFANSRVVVSHPQGGVRVFNLDDFERLINNGKQIPMKSGSFDMKECLLIRMHKSNHPEQTISYRFEEGPTGEVFVFVTDHENQDGIPSSFRQHLANSDLLVMDAQYTREKYEKLTSGWGHGTPDYIARVAKMVGAKTVGLTHHDPFSSDANVDRIVGIAQELLGDSGIKAFGCRDYMTMAVR